MDGNKTSSSSVRHHRAPALPRVQRFDGLQGPLHALEPVGDVLVQLQVARLVVLDQRRNLGPPLEPAKGLLGLWLGLAGWLGFELG